MNVFVKICGLCSADDVAAVAALRPDALGFVFWAASPRTVAPAAVAAWTRDLPPGLLKVGVFVDAAPDAIRRIAEEAGLDVVQWHPFPPAAGAGPAAARAAEAAFFQSLEKPPRRFSKVWKVVRPRAGERPPAAEGVDAFVVDSYSAQLPGGTGQPADWDAAAAWAREAARPVILAGGLRPENVRAALRAVRPWGVDVSSGVETRPGVKDPARVKDLIEQCRNA